MTTVPADAPPAPPAPPAEPSSQNSGWREPTSTLPLSWGGYRLRYLLGVVLLVLAGLGIFWRAWHLAFTMRPPIFPAVLDRMLAGQPPAAVVSLGQMALLIVAGVLIMPARHGRRWLALGALMLVYLCWVLVQPFTYSEAAPLVVAVVGILAWLVLRDRSGLAYAVGLPAALVAAFLLEWLLDRLPLPELPFHWWIYYAAPPLLVICAAAWLVRALEPRFGARRELARTTAEVRRSQLGAASEAEAIAAQERAIAAQVRTMAALQEAWNKEHPGEPMPAIAVSPQVAAPAATDNNNVLAVLSLVFGLLGGGLVAVVLGHMARAQIRRTGERGDGMAIAGLVLGYLGLAVGVAYFAVVADALASLG